MSKLIIANWKSNKTAAQVEEWFQGISINVPAEAQVVIAPSFHELALVATKLPARVMLGAQDVSSFPMGSYTGAVNAQQLKAEGVSYVIVGHSERRRYFHETHQDIAAKVEQVVANAMSPILCVDEDYIDAQADALESASIPNLVVAYEPLAAIGNGHNAPVDQVTRVIGNIKQKFGDVPVIYGGSVDERSVHEYLLVSDGVLVGTASLDPQSFSKVVMAAKV